MPQSDITDEHMASRGRDKDDNRDMTFRKKVKQPNLFSPTR